jgi:hypothetical protein
MVAFMRRLPLLRFVVLTAAFATVLPALPGDAEVLVCNRTINGCTLSGIDYTYGTSGVSVTCHYSCGGTRPAN